MPELYDPDLIAKNECIGVLFAPVTGKDPFLNDAMRSAIDYALSAEYEQRGPALLEDFMRKAVELSLREDGQALRVGLYHLNLRGRVYEPLWVRMELLAALKPMTGQRESLLVVSGLGDSVRLSLPRRARKVLQEQSIAEAHAYIDALCARFTARDTHLRVLYQAE